MTGIPPEQEAAAGAAVDLAPLDLKSVLAELTTLLKPLSTLLDIQPSKPESVSSLERGLARLPAAESIGSQLQEWKSRAERAVKEIRRARVEQFGRWEAMLIARAREEGTPLREGEGAWRIGPLELVLDRSGLRAEVRYNEQPVVPWRPVEGAESLAKLIADGRKELERRALPEAELIDVFWNAFDEARARRQRLRLPTPELIPLPDFQREVRLELVRRELAGRPKEAARKLTNVDLPMWAFLHEVDRYRALGDRIAGDKKLGFQTGGQLETREYGLVLNGLNAMAPYKKYCYVLQGRGNSDE